MPPEATPKYVTHTPELIAGFFGPYRFLSNFHPAKVVLAGQAYPSVEHAYQAAKMPAKERAAFLTCSAAESKRLGRQAALPANWDTDKFPIMGNLVFQKFLFDMELRSALLATGTARLVERNHWQDRTWGEDLAGNGTNYLGELLMRTRAYWQALPQTNNFLLATAL